VGEHTAQILGEIGFANSEIDAMLAEGVVATQRAG
jgi:crotonobetainyl-CoA:carnitine CoA-transferase CaiB-like acyl-CoA transferase